MNKYIKLLKNTAWIFLGTAGCRLLQFLLLPYLTAWLTPAEYGIKDLLVIYASILAGLFSFKLEDAVFLYSSGASAHKRSEYFCSAMIFTMIQSGIWSVILWGCSKILSPGNFLAEYWLWLLAITFASTLFLLFQEFCRGTDHMLLYSTSGLVYTATTVAGALILIPHYRIFGYLTAILSGYSSGLLVMLVVLGIRTVLRRPRHFAVTLKKMLRFSLPILPNGIIWLVTTSLNRPLLEHWCSLAAVGLFAIANKIPLLLDSVWAIFFNSWQLSAVQEYHHHNFASYFNRIFNLLWKLFVFVCSILTISTEIYVPLLFGEAYHEVVQYIPMLLVGILFSIFAGLLGSLFTASGESRFFLYSALGTLAVALLLNFLLIPNWGLWGAVWALNGTLLSQFLLRIAFSHHLVRLVGTSKNILALSAFGMILFAYYGILLGGVRCGIYGLALIVEAYLLYKELRGFRKIIFSCPNHIATFFRKKTYGP